MDPFGQSAVTRPFRSPATTLGDLDAANAAQLLAAAGDVTMVLDRDGIIRDVALAREDLERDGIGDWIDQPWIDTVTSDSRGKIDDLLRDATQPAAARRWRQVNHPIVGPDTVPIRYMAIETGRNGGIVAIGRDLRSVAAMQQRLLAAQQSMERDYLRLRQAEQRYRLLFETSSEAVLVVDGETRRIGEANPAAEALIGVTERALTGQPLHSIVDQGGRDGTEALLGLTNGRGTGAPVPLRLASGTDVLASATIFRREGGAAFLVRLLPIAGDAARRVDPNRHLLELLERLPDAFVVTGASLEIAAVNAAFLELAQLATLDAARGLPLGELLGRPGIDLGALTAQLDEHGAVRSFATVFRPRFGDAEEVEVSGVIAPGDPPHYGFSIRSARRDRAPAGPALPRSVEQLTELVGRVSLREIVRESTDMIERLCIEAALKYTADNRASAAEILGLSRQSLYSKLHRHGIGNLGSEAE